MGSIVIAPRHRLRLDISRHIGVLAIAAMLAIAACDNSGGAPASPGESADPDALAVVATTTVLADLVRQVGGSHVSVASLVPPGGEVHTFDPTPTDIARVADADLVFTNGLGLDEWLGDLARDSGTRATIVELGEDLDGVDYLAGEAHEGETGEDEADHEGEAVNPHLWLNVQYAIKYAERIAEGLAAADPGHATDYAANAEAYVARLTELDEWAREQVAAVPEADRRIVSFHEAFPYFAAAYGLEIVGTIIDVPGQDPSAGEIARLVDAIRASGARAIFSEAQFNDELAETVAEEAGITVESDLYSDSLGDPPVDTYEGLIRWNVEHVVDALTS
jgi:zinc/manganese transport system substrate-binding protein/manganese/iron transport system substrate-binding protein